MDTSLRTIDDPNCRICDDPMVRIDLLVDGRPLTLRSCGDCGHRIWFDRSDQVSLDGVLAVITDAGPRYRRDMSADQPSPAEPSA